jgi:hypothetical protein
MLRLRGLHIPTSFLGKRNARGVLLRSPFARLRVSVLCCRARARVSPPCSLGQGWGEGNPAIRTRPAALTLTLSPRAKLYPHCSSPPGGGGFRWGDSRASLHPHPDPPPSRGRGTIPPGEGITWHVLAHLGQVALGTMPPGEGITPGSASTCKDVDHAEPSGRGNRLCDVVAK